MMCDCAMSRAAGRPSTGTMVWQADGNVVLYAGTVATWSSRTTGGAVNLVLHADGNLTITRAATAGTVASGTTKISP